MTGEGRERMKGEKGGFDDDRGGEGEDERGRGEGEKEKGREGWRG